MSIIKRELARLICLATIIIGCGGASGALAITNAAGDELPAWAKGVAAAGTPAYDKKVPAVVLLDESRATVGADGRIVRSSLYAVRILTREGRHSAIARALYYTDGGKVRDLRAWMVRPNGTIKKFGKDQTLDLALSDNDIYNEARIKMIDASDEADAGMVFAFESSTEERTIFTQDECHFQDRLPVLNSRCIVEVPAGWRAESITFNHAKIEPTVSGTTYVWQLSNLPFIEPEPDSPPVSNLAPRIAVSYFPENGQPPTGTRFNTWQDVSKWLTTLTDAQSAVTAPLAAKARELTANSKTELEKIQAVGRYVQNIQYISIQLGLGRGGGYRPRAATEVFSKSYGDCKDKANLMRAMLRAVGIDAYLMPIYSGDATYVRVEFPSPQQFNHCIVAVKVSEATDVPTVITHEALGRLLIFDPTDENTPVGDLDDAQQNSFALLVAWEKGALLRMPMTPPDANMLERETVATLQANGTLSATVTELSHGQAAVDERRLFRHYSRADYTKMIEEWIARGAARATVTNVEPADDALRTSFKLSVKFSAEGYGQVMQNRLMIFKPAIVSRRDWLTLTDQQRKQPVVIEPHAYTETVRITLPEGFAVDEMPDAVKMTSDFGSYATEYKVQDRTLTFTRRLILRSATVPSTQYASVRSFFERVRTAEQSPVVLVKK